MKLSEAYSILELQSGASPEEAKKKYRELTKKYHPDINKEPGAEDKFKKINEAYQVVTSGKGTDPMGVGQTDFNWNPFGRQTVFEAENINAYTTISFTDSILGTKKEIKFNRKAKCPTCNGQGSKPINNGCTTCGGKGRIVNQDKGTLFITTCSKCAGVSKTEDCKNCNGFATVDSEASVYVTIPGGTVNGSILRLAGMGNFMGTFMFSIEQHSDVHLHVTVPAEPGLTLDGRNVVSKLEITLLEALRGCNKRVKTIVGYSDIEVKPKSRNGDIIIIPKLGVSRIEDQKVILDVKYPDDINKIIDVLTKERIN